MLRWRRDMRRGGKEEGTMVQHVMQACVRDILLVVSTQVL